MQFIKRHLYPMLGDHRIRTFFAVLPVSVYDFNSRTKETRWLETVTVTETLVHPYDRMSPHWRADRFLPAQPDRFIPDNS